MTTVDLDNRVFLVDKSPGPTSFDVVAAFRHAARVRKVGHTGTLDPLARGVLILCTGVATRAVEHFMNLEKEYEFDVFLGVETDTLDAEGEVVREAPCPAIGRDDLQRAADTFIGSYRMVPPVFSALKRNGRRMYEAARAGEPVDEAPARTVTIYGWEVARVDLPRVTCVVRCSRGTYVRSLARDFGRRFDLPAHVARLVRRRVGPFERGDGIPSEKIMAGDLEGVVGLELGAALAFLPAAVLTARGGRNLLYGQLPTPADVARVDGAIGPGASVRLLDDDGRLLALGRRGTGDDRDRLHLVDTFRLVVDPVRALSEREPR